MISLRSKISQKVLGYFLLNPQEEMYLNEISRKFKVDRGNLTKKLAEWERERIVIKNKKGNLSLYRINKRYPFYNEFKKIFNKSYGLPELLKKIMKNVPGLKMAVIFGSYAKNRLSAESDIDLLLVGSHKSLALQDDILKLQNQINREINVVDMTEEEFKKKRNGDFLRHILAGKFIKII